MSACREGCDPVARTTALTGFAGRLTLSLQAVIMQLQIYYRQVCRELLLRNENVF